MGATLRNLVLYPLVFLGTCTGTTFGVASWGLERAIEPVEGTTPPSFPLVVLTGPADAPSIHPLLARQLDSFEVAHADVRFRIPEERAETLLETLQADTRTASEEPFAPGDDRPWSADFEIEESGPDGQLVRASVVYDDDDVNDGWYRATDEGITPLRHRTAFGPGFAMLGGLLGLVAGSIALSLVGRIGGGEADPG